MLGGSSSINWMVYVRGVEEDFEEWASFGNPDWNYDGVLPFFKKSEGNQNESLVNYDGGKYHSATGPVKITSNTPSSFFTAITEAYRESGVPIISDINADEGIGITLLQSSTYNGTRYSTAEAFLVPAKGRPNLHVVKHAHVDSIVLDENNRATGVKFTYKSSRKITATTKKEVIISGGTVLSPAILMRSGIGPKKHLKERNIQPRVDLPVGDNFKDHPCIVLKISLNISTTSISPTFELDSLYEYVQNNSGALTTYPILSGCLNTENNTDGPPDHQLILALLPKGSTASSIKTLNTVMNIEKWTDEEAKFNAQFDVLSMIITLIKPKSTGTIRLNNCTSCQEVLIDSQYLSDPDDRARAIKAIQHQVALLETQPFQKLGATLQRIPLEKCDHLEFKSAAYWDCYITYFSFPGSHMVGTSRMGNGTNAVVDSRCRVHKTKGLRQIDAGIVPDSMRANTNAVSMMVGEKCSELVKEDYGRSSAASNS
ncbi:glucose dehydrogenase [FAD, quinone]-like [Sitodiplosis mosellana]|uniref:glucose dehydrogenase [FAD, quinone]-like n=1 Tax=Sitodiplosis mosellana TaxID=263140 RepID=UPI0024446E93|nr:glucose dehydrogenase [FAD, quinone]-like [Sitodiplosis mosellana]